MKKWITQWAPFLPVLAMAVALALPLLGGDDLMGSEGMELEAPAQRTYGAVYGVPGFAWATLLNQDRLASADLQLNFWDNCLLRYRGRVQEITSHWSFYTWWSEDVLVEYTNPPGSPATGVLCPDGAVFLLPRDELATYEPRFAERQAYEAELRDEVSTALAAGERGAARPVEGFFRWVEVANPKGVENFGYRVPFLDACGIESGGTVRVVDTTSHGPLYEYEPRPQADFRGVGIPCPPQTVFFWRSSTATVF